MEGMVLRVSGNQGLPSDDLLGDVLLNYDTSPGFSFDMKQFELGFVFTLVLAGALGAVETQRQIPTGMKPISDGGFATLAPTQSIPPGLSTSKAP